MLKLTTSTLRSTERAARMKYRLIMSRVAADRYHGSRLTKTKYRYLTDAPNAPEKEEGEEEEQDKKSCRFTMYHQRLNCNCGRAVDIDHANAHQAPCLARYIRGRKTRTRHSRAEDAKKHRCGFVRQDPRDCDEEEVCYKHKAAVQRDKVNGHANQRAPKPAEMARKHDQQPTCCPR